MQGILGAYRIITQTLHVEAHETAIAWIDRTYLRRFTFIRAFVALACLVSIVASFLQVSTGVSFGFLALGLVGLLSLQFLRRSFAKGLAQLRDEACDPALYCNRYLALLKQSKSAADPTEEVFEYAMGLYWLGRWTDAEKLMGALGDIARKPKNLYLYHHLIARCAWAQRDSATLANSIHALETLSTQPIAKEQGPRLAELRALAELLEHEQAGDFEAARKTIAMLLSQPHGTKAQRVMLAIHSAYCSTDAAEATTWLDYAAQFGGTTWCAAEAQRLLDKTV